MNESELLEKHAQSVYNLALRLTGNAADAEDLAQDALLRALKALPGFRGESAASTWLYRITVNAWKNRVRSEKRRKFWKFLSRREEEGAQADVRADDPPLDAGLEAAETTRAVQEALSSLDEDGRAVVVLRDIQGLSYQDIAAALEIPEGTVKSRLSRARDALKERLKRFVRQG